MDQSTYTAVLVLWLSLVVLSCGPPQAADTPLAAPEALEAHLFLLDYGNYNVELLQPPDGTAEELEEAASEAEGSAAARARLDAAVAHLFEAQDSEEGNRGHLRSASKLARRAARGADDPAIESGAAFLRLWVAWRRERANASRLARRFHDDHGEAPEGLARLAYAICGEMALVAEDWDRATASFRQLVGSTEDPLYVYSLYRLARSLEGQGQGRRGRRLLRQVRDLGCAAGAPEQVQHLARLASVELGTGQSQTEDGRIVPATCVD